MLLAKLRLCEHKRESSYRSAKDQLMLWNTARFTVQTFISEAHISLHIQ
jgi:hypothetical protein